MTITCKIITITPAKATELLGQNIGNRNKRPNAVHRYAQDMKAGNWLVGSGCIVVDDEGVLVDGQHRLQACVDADVPFTTAMIAGVSPDVRKAIDQGVSRSLADVLTWIGEVQTQKLGAAVRAGHMWANGRQLSNRMYGPTVEESIQWLHANPGIRDALNLSAQLQHAFRTRGAVTAAAIHRIRLHGGEQGEQFIDAVRTGAGLDVGHPALALRNWLVSEATKAKSRDLPNPHAFLTAWVHTWNAVAKGKTLKLYKNLGATDVPVLLDASGRPALMADETVIRQGLSIVGKTAAA